MFRHTKALIQRMKQIVKGHIIFDHDGTLVSANKYGISLFPGVIELLKNLKAENYKIYVWTARGRNSTLGLLKENKILEYFDNFSCGDDGEMKPNPHGPLKMFENFEKEKTIHIGDSIGDLEGAGYLAIDFIYAAWNDYESGLEFKKIIPNVAFSLEECKKIIDSKFN